MFIRSLVLLVASIGYAPAFATKPILEVPRHLPGELSAEAILNGEYPWSNSPEPVLEYNFSGLASKRLATLPEPGIHPRILVTPAELPELRHRLRETASGRAMLITMRGRIAATIGRPDSWENNLFEALAAADADTARAILERELPPSSSPGHYQPHILYALVMAAFDALISDDATDGRRTATAIATYTNIIEPAVIDALSQPLNDDVWRVKVSGSHTGAGSEGQGVRKIVGYHLLGYAYDFSHPYMTDSQRSDTRRVIAEITNGRVWLGARLPHHWRNWNWVMVALSQPLLALAIEGEDGYDPRVFRLGVKIARDYLTHGISASGSSTESVGYTQFGLVWGNPFLIAAARRGEDLLAHPHFRAMPEWYLQTMEPYAPELKSIEDYSNQEQTDRGLPATWSSTGDGGDEGPSRSTMMMWKRHFPQDPTVDLIFRTVLSSIRGNAFDGRYHIIEPMIWSSDAGIGEEMRSPTLSKVAETTQAPLTWFDPDRGSLIARSDWSSDATAVHFEARVDSHTASHEHADRGSFTLSANGRRWARDGFRSIESRHHNLVLIDGQGQGFFPGPGHFIGVEENDWAVIAAADLKNAYDWFWPKQILTEDPHSFDRFKFSRWSQFSEDATEFQKLHPASSGERDPHPQIARFYQEFETNSPRFWDEDAWPVRFPHNPVQRAFRTVFFARGESPYMIVIDDIQKDDRERLYEWLMFPGSNTAVESTVGDNILLRDTATNQNKNRRLLVQALDLGLPRRLQDYGTRPSHRLEFFEKKDTLKPGGRTFGLDRRLVVASRSSAPRFKILLYPHIDGQEMPTTTWNLDRTALDIVIGNQQDRIVFTLGDDGRTRLTATRQNSTLSLP